MADVSVIGVVATILIALAGAVGKSWADTLFKKAQFCPLT